MNTTTEKPLGVVNVGQNDFENEVLRANEPVLVDFWAEWCGPCRMIGPVIESLAIEYNGQVKFAKVAVDDHQDLCAKYGIRSIPTLLLFRNGELVDRIVGAVSRTYLTEKLSAQLSRSGAAALDAGGGNDSFTK
jgi:thioredoxin 1